MKKVDLKKLSKYDDEYVAFSTKSSKILAAGKSINEIEKKLKKLDIKDAVIQYMPPLEKFLSPVCL